MPIKNVGRWKLFCEEHKEGRLYVSSDLEDHGYSICEFEGCLNVGTHEVFLVDDENQPV